MRGTGDDFRQRAISSDPFQPYLEAQYRRIVSFLRQALISMIDLTAADTPDVVDAPPRQRDMLDLFFTAHGLEEQPEAGKPFGTFSQAFEHYNRRVLQLGEPGAGKTITLMAYARDAIAARLDDPTKPLPLLGLIATWDSQRQQPLADWLVMGHDDLVAEIRRIVADARALLLLDGLDELGSVQEEPDPNNPEKLIRYDPRQRFIPIIPASNQVIVTCRAKDYREIGKKIGLKGAVTLQQLTDAQIRDYLSAEVPDLWATLEADEELREVTRTPLLLSLFAFAYRDASAEDREKLRDLRESLAICGTQFSGRMCGSGMSMRRTS